MSAGPELALDQAGPESSGWGDEAEAPYRADDPEAPPDVVTRLLCAATHLHMSFADYVNAQLLKVSYSAICPSWGVDHVALARHATLSRKRRLERDRKLVRTTLALAGATLVVLLLSLGPLSFMTAVLLELIVLLGGIAYSWTLVFHHYRAARLDAMALVDGADPRGSADPLAPEVEDRLDELRNGNVVVFSGATPFVGSGIYLDDWTITLDLTEGSTNPATGAQREPKFFDAAELHREMLRMVPLGDLSDIRARNRLYVSGTHAPGVAGIVPPPVPRRQRPKSSLSEEELERIILEPQEGARVYATFEKPGWRGQIIVSMFLRAARYENTLFIEGASFVLLPLSARFYDVYELPLRKSEELRAVALTAATKAVPLLIGSIGRRLRSRRGGRDDREALEAIEELRERNRDVDFGASKSIRSETADSERSKHYASVDEFMYFLVLRRRVWTCLKDFLGTRGIDTADLDRQIIAIVDRTGIFKARDLKSGEE